MATVGAAATSTPPDPRHRRQILIGVAAAIVLILGTAAWFVVRGAGISPAAADGSCPFVRPVKGFTIVEPRLTKDKRQLANIGHTYYLSKDDQPGYDVVPATRCYRDVATAQDDGAVRDPFEYRTATSRLDVAQATCNYESGALLGEYNYRNPSGPKFSDLVDRLSRTVTFSEGSIAVYSAFVSAYPDYIPGLAGTYLAPGQPIDDALLKASINATDRACRSAIAGRSIDPTIAGAPPTQSPPTSTPAAPPSSAPPPSGGASGTQDIACDGTFIVRIHIMLNDDQIAAQLPQLLADNPGSKAGFVPPGCSVAPAAKAPDSLVIYQGPYTEFTDACAEWHALGSHNVDVLRAGGPPAAPIAYCMCPAIQVYGQPTLSADPTAGLTSGPAVQELSAFLTEFGYGPNAQAGQTTFDQGLAVSVEQFQAANGLAPDGVVGPQTWQAIQFNACSVD